MSSTTSTARFLWQRLEPFHGLIYFVPEADQHYTALGLDAGMMGYFSSRAAAMGAVNAEVTIAEYRAGNAKAMNALVGQAMKATKGKANPAQVNALLKQKLG